MRLKRFGLVFSSLLAIALLFSAPAGAATTYVNQHVIWINGAPLPASLTSDIGFADTDNYYMTDRMAGGVDVFNAKDDFFIGTFAPGQFTGVATSNTRGPNGVLVDDKHQIWAGDGNSTVKVGTLATGITHNISTGGTTRADELGFDPTDHLVVVGNDKETPPYLTFISTDTYTVLSQLRFDGTGGTPVATGMEQPAWNPVTGLIYQSVPTAAGGEVDAIDPHTRQVVQRFPVPGCGSMTGLAVGLNGNLASACSTGGRILRATDGFVLATLPASTAPSDEIWYNPTEKVYLYGITTGGLAIVDATTNTLMQVLTYTLPTGVTRCCAPAANPANNHIYQPLPGVGVIVTFRQPASPAPTCVSSFVRRC